MNKELNNTAVKWLFIGFILSFILGGLLVSSCSKTFAADTPATSAPAIPRLVPSLTDLLMKGFQNVDENLHKAIRNNELPANDPLTACVDSMVGTQNPNAEPYNNDGPLELASIAYIKINSLQTKGAAVSQSCDALTGKFLRDALRNAPVNPARFLFGG